MSRPGSVNHAQAKTATSLAQMAQRVRDLERRLEDQIVASRQVLALAGKDVDARDAQSVARAVRAFNVLEEATTASAQVLFR